MTLSRSLLLYAFVVLGLGTPLLADLSFDYLSFKPTYFPDDHLAVWVRYTAEDDLLPPTTVKVRLDDAFGQDTLVPSLGEASLPQNMSSGESFKIAEWIVPNHIPAHYILDSSFRLVLLYDQEKMAGEGSVEQVTDREVTLLRVQAIPGGPEKHPLYTKPRPGSYIPGEKPKSPIHGGDGSTGELSVIRVADEGEAWASLLYYGLLRHFVM